MGYDITNLATNRGGAVMEVSDGAAPTGGLYRHPNGAELVTLDDPLYGSPQSAAAVRIGFVRVGDVPEGYVKTIYEVAKEAEETKGAAGITPADLKGMQARLEAQDKRQDALEAENTALKAAVATAPAQEAETPAKDAEAPKDEAPKGDVQNETSKEEGK